MNKIDPAIEAQSESNDLNEAARVELDRLLDDSQFRSPPRRKTMLRYIVETTLAGQGDELTAVPIAQSVFGRDGSFDHQSDPVVRIEAHRLRNDLAVYYAGAGRNNPVRITIPKGHYVAHFDWADLPEQGETPEQRHEPVPERSGLPVQRVMSAPAGIVAIVALLVASGIVFLWARSDEPVAPGQSGPAVMVLPFRTMNGDVDPALADGFVHEIVTGLLRFPDIRVVAPGQAPQTAAAIRLHDNGAVSYALEGTIGVAGASLRIGARLVRLEDDNVIWSESYDRSMTAGNLMNIETEIASEIASRLGQSSGVINNDMLARSGGAIPRFDSYLCILKAYHYRRNPPGNALYRPIETCLEKTVAEDPDYAEAWAMLALLLNDAVRFNRVPPDEVAETYSEAEQAAMRSIAIDKNNVNGLIALSAINYYQGNFDVSEKYARQAVENNPNDPDTLAILASRLILRGNVREGAPMMGRSIATSINPAGWQYAVLAVAHLADGDYDAMLETAQRGTIDGSAMNQSVLAMAYGMLGDRESASLALTRMNEISPGYDPVARLKVHQVTDEILSLMSEALKRAGMAVRADIDAVSTTSDADGS